jgi:hypothetical protein
MIDLAGLIRKATFKYSEVLGAVIQDLEMFPLVIKTNKAIDKKHGLEFIFYQQEELLLNSKNKTGLGYSLELKYNSKTRQSEISKIVFETLHDYLSSLQKIEEFTLFEINLKTILDQFVALKPLLIKNPRIVIEQAGNWPNLLKVCQYFYTNPYPNLYVRALPIEISTKFIESNQGILRTLLDVILAGKLDESQSNFFMRYGLMQEDAAIKIRFLDTGQSIHPALSQVTVWVSEFQKLNLPSRKILIVENLTTFLSLPNLTDTLAIWGGGFAVTLLKNVEWLKSKTIYYWGDIDIHGFQILSQVRDFFPDIISVLMDEDVFDKFDLGLKGDGFRLSEKLNLNTKESKIYEKVMKNNFRLEQEKIPQDYVIDILKQKIQN